MDVILKGILSSNHPYNIKRDLLIKIAEKGSSSQSSGTVQSVLELTVKWFLEGDSDLQCDYGLEIYKSWARHNLVTFEEFFNKDYLLTILSKKYRNSGNVGILLTESMKLLQRTSMFRQHCTVIEAKAVSYVKEHPYIECLTNFAEFLLEFKECVPKGDLTLHFCTNLILSLSLCSPPEVESGLVVYIKSANTVASLLSQIWSSSDSQVVLGCLKEIFRIISSPCDVEPSVCLGSLVQYLPVEMIGTVVKNVISDSSIDNNSMVTAIQRIIDWLQWPTARFVDHWVIAFLKGLASVQKYSILITVTENKADQIFEKLQFAPVREPGLNIICHMLLSFQHSPEPFHKILPMVPKIVGEWKADSSEFSQHLVTRLAELLHVLMYLHGGFPELYDPVYEVIKVFPKPSPDVIKFKLLESKWTAHRDGQAYVPRSYQPKAEMGKTGLFNLGNTCYMNSIIQALYMCDSFRNGLLQHQPSLEQSLVVKLQYVFAFLSLSQRPAYAPVNFLAASRPVWFTAGFQQDCSEFLKYLLDQLHEQETKYLTASRSPKSPSKEKRKSESTKPTLIEENFGGTMSTTLTCLNCKAESKKEEMFMDLPLAFPDYNSTSQKSLAGGDSKMSTRSHTTTSTAPRPTTSVPPEEMNCLHLNDLLKHYLKPEKLVDDNKYFCDNCGGLQEGERKIKIVKTPEYLILTLLRFSYDTKLQSRSKIFREVKYPKTLLIPVEDEARGATSERRKRCNSLRSSVANQLEKCGLDMDVDCADVYSLCSVVVHSGTSSDCGHYYCYARHSVITNSENVQANMQDFSHEDEIDFLQDKWYLFNDSRVSYASYNSFCNVSQRFTKDTAYVLMYRKIDAEKIGVDYKIGLDQWIQPTKIDAPLRSDLRAAVVKDNKIYLQEQENAAAKNSSRKRPNDSTWYNWKDDDDKGGTGPCGGGGGSLGDLDTSGARFVF
ncbi:ubiquitin carboxyl-terminal hydrolase 38-like isoform X2 [Mercenaria mercenaria]|nr:ubiquitin carboxyl-terminal hydrolase 38-like isoform X2 [Mercenaria mercenaria]XP_053399269.1 ubiquitin carboxyl-terminal hydrolase 38-like isoform X2 [Mercenaria mercenaria]XP_053399270.1 ubiquitin carboxyl-terminal hydrolase 38-like isoform X2 [Mercenaria mercenaria]